MERAILVNWTQKEISRILKISGILIEINYPSFFLKLYFSIIIILSGCIINCEIVWSKKFWLDIFKCIQNFILNEKKLQLERVRLFQFQMNDIEIKFLFLISKELSNVRPSKIIIIDFCTRKASKPIIKRRMHKEDHV